MFRLLVIGLLIAFGGQATAIAGVIDAEADCCGAEAHPSEGGDAEAPDDCLPGCCAGCAPVGIALEAPQVTVVRAIVPRVPVTLEQRAPVEPEPRRVRHVPRLRTA